MQALNGKEAMDMFGSLAKTLEELRRLADGETPCDKCGGCGWIKPTAENNDDGVPMPRQKFDGRVAMAKFRKKPVVIEAVQWTGVDVDEVMPFFGDMTKLPSDGIHIEPGVGHTPATGELYIPTLEGVMSASPGDWIIKGVKGEFYPCKPDIFAATYEPMDE